ncbi:hypothetical protein [Streptomyces sp. NPDC012888]|uniref:SCO2584 family spore wall biosynthesis protein n=1 Tax=Streptomyces sp. NPDC012888 TaxID=3364855 RepID=UPI003679F306
MPDDVGGKPFQDDGEPDENRGAAEWDFASVVFDEAFVRSAEIHEPSAAERRREAEAARAVAGGLPADEDPFEGYPFGWTEGDPDRHRGDGTYDGPYDPYREYGDDPYGAYGGALRPYRGRSRWLRPVAWVLAVVMGVGMVALAFTAVYRGSTGDDGQGPPPARTPLTEVSGDGAFTYPVGRQP